MPFCEQILRCSNTPYTICTDSKLASDKLDATYMNPSGSFILDTIADGEGRYMDYLLMFATGSTLKSNFWSHFCLKRAFVAEALWCVTLVWMVLVSAMRVTGFRQAPKCTGQSSTCHSICLAINTPLLGCRH